MSALSLERALHRIGPEGHADRNAWLELIAIVGRLPGHDPAGRAQWLWARAQADSTIAAELDHWWRAGLVKGEVVANSVAGNASIGTLVQGRDIQVHLPPELPRPRPQQLPPALGGAFVNRTREFAACIGTLERDGGRRRGRPAVAGLHGLGGVGKSALAVEIAHQVRDRYPDGVLYKDLARYRGDGGIALSDILAELLRALGTDPKWIPAEPAARQEEFRSLAADRRLLIVLEGAQSAEEVGFLLPASEGSAVLVTSRVRLDRLGEPVPVGALSQEHSEEILAGIIQQHRTAAEPEALAALARLCGGVPLALDAAGGWAADRPLRSLSDLVTELTNRQNSPDASPNEWEQVVEAMWDDSYRLVGADARLLYRLLADLPGTDFGLPAALAAGHLGLDRTEQALGSLLAVGLLEEADGQRVRFQPRVREHARRTAQAADPTGAVREMAWQRTVHWYRRQAERADRVVLGDRLRYADPLDARYGPDVDFGPGVDSTAAADPRADGDDGTARAVRWLDEERHALLECMRTAARLGEHETVWRLCEPLWALMMSVRPYEYWVTAFTLAAQSAAQCERPLLLTARLRSQLAYGYWAQGEYEAARAELRQALAAAEVSGDVRSKAMVLEFTGKAALAEGDLDGARRAFEASLRINEEIGRARGVRLQLHHLGQVLRRQGEHEEAVAVLERARAMRGDGPDGRTDARIATTLGRAYLDTGRHPDALAALERAAAVMAQRGTPVDEVPALEALVAAAEVAGDGPRAAEARVRLLVAYERSGNPAAAALRSGLAGR